MEQHNEGDEEQAEHQYSRRSAVSRGEGRIIWAHERRVSSALLKNAPRADRAVAGHGASWADNRHRWRSSRGSQWQREMLAGRRAHLEPGRVIGVEPQDTCSLTTPGRPARRGRPACSRAPASDRATCTSWASSRRAGTWPLGEGTPARLSLARLKHVARAHPRAARQRVTARLARVAQTERKSVLTMVRSLSLSTFRCGFSTAALQRPTGPQYGRTVATAREV